MAADLARVVARDDEFRDAVGKYKVRERGGVLTCSAYNGTLCGLQGIHVF